MAVGRISGPLLKENLIRNGIDLAFETDLLYLDVNNQRIGVKTTSPTHELQVNGTTKTTNLIVDTTATLADVTIENNTISTTEPFLNLATLDTVVSLNKLRIDSIDIEGNAITTNNSNANLELRPNGTGSVDIHSDLNVTGNIHATGNISADGNITIGDADTDNVIFNAEVSSDIIPDVTNTYALGSDPSGGGKAWNDVWVNNLIASSVNVDDLDLGDIDITLRYGNMLYVAENGNDSNSGDHILDPYATIKFALSQATAGDTVFINPGVYLEEFPLTVPQGVTVKGQGIRSVSVTPTTLTRYNDAFLLNGETTIEDLTVTGFYSGGNFYQVTSSGAGTATFNIGATPQPHTYASGGTITFGATEYNVSNATYDNVTGILTITHSGPAISIGSSVFVSSLTFSCNGDTRVFPDNGYAFRYATDYAALSRSPYIRNITVITQGSVTSAGDPRGFDAGDAGKGAYIDGAYGTASSVNTALLFHSATFITPGVDTITMTNGARVEWLNSFTYFANRSMLAYDSNAGRRYAGKTKLTLAGITGTFVQGNTLTITSTDASTVLTGTISSVDGNDVYVSGYLDLNGFDLTPQSITDGTATATSIASFDLREFGAEVRLIGSASVYGNFGLVGNGPGVIMYAIGHNLAYIGNGKEVTNNTATVIQANEVVENNGANIRYNSVDHKGDFRVGNLFYVNQESGNVTFAVNDFTINTENGVSFVTGSDTTFIDGSKIETGDWRISGNTIETLTQDATFEAASGQINLNSDVNIDGSLDVTGNVTIGGNITIGDEATDTIQIIAGIDSNIIPKLDSAYSLGTATKKWSNLYINEINLDSITIRDNFITTTDSNSDLELRANGTGEILIPSNNLQINNNLTVSGDTDLQDTDVTGTITHIGNTTQTGNYTLTGQFTNGNIQIDGNVIETTLSNSDLEIRANAGGTINVPNNDVTFSQALTVSGDTDLQDTNVTGTITHIGDTTQTGDTVITGNVTVTQDLDVSGAAQFEEILVDDNFITTTTSNADLELRANGTGKVVIPNNNLLITNDLEVNGTITVDNINSTGILTASSFNTGDILISGNVVKTTLSNSDLELRANGTGNIYIPTNNVVIDENLTVIGSTNLQDVNIQGNITQTGNTDLTGNIDLTGDLGITGNISVSSTAQFENIKIEDNFIITTDSNSDLELRATEYGDIVIPSNDVVISNDLYVTGTISVGDINSAGTITANRFSTGDILIDDNFITTTASNSDLELRANGTGEILVPSNNVTITQNLTVNNDTSLTDTTINGTVTHVGNVNQIGDFNLTGNLDVTGEVIISASVIQFEEIELSGNAITTTDSNADLELRANGTGEILIPSNNVIITNNLTVNGTIAVDNITSNSAINANTFSTGDILIDDNFITTTISNSNLELRAAGTGSIIIDTFSINSSTISTTGDFNITPGSEIININATSGIKLPVGTTAQRPADEAGYMRFNTDLNRYEGYNGTNWVNLKGVEDLDGNTKVTAELTEGSNDNKIRFYTNGTVVADIDNTRLSVPKIDVGSIQIDGNLITTTTADTNLVLTANGTGSVRFDNFAFKENSITNSEQDSITNFTSTGNGYYKFGGTYGVVIPVGESSERPPFEFTELGQVRFNTDDQRVEVWDGTNWVSVAGASSGITRNDAEEIALGTVLVLG